MPAKVNKLTARRSATRNIQPGIYDLGAVPLKSYLCVYEQLRSVFFFFFWQSENFRATSLPPLFYRKERKNTDLGQAVELFAVAKLLVFRPNRIAVVLFVVFGAGDHGPLRPGQAVDVRLEKRITPGNEKKKNGL